LTTAAARPKRYLARAVLLALSVWALTLTAGPLGATPPASAATPRTVTPLQRFSAALANLVQMPEGPPGAIAVVQVGSQVQVISQGRSDIAPQGSSDVTSAQLPTPDETARIASVSKAYNGAITLALVSRERLSLSDTVGRILPTLPKAWSAVTVAQLLQHTSGVPDYIKSPELLKLLQADPQAALSPMQLLGFVTSQPLLFTSGSKYDYSDSDNIVLGLMDEAVTHESYQRALAQYVTTPLRLPDTLLPASAALTTPYLHGYVMDAGQPPEDVSTALNPVLAWASGGMVSTPIELNTFMRAYVSGRLFSRATHTRQFRFVAGGSGPPGPGTNSAGLAVYRYATRCGTVYGHTGNFPGYTIFAASTSNGRRSVDVIVNTQLQDSPGNTRYQALAAAEGLGVCAALRS